jgi:hypothetical protein
MLHAGAGSQHIDVHVADGIFGGCRVILRSIHLLNQSAKPEPALWIRLPNDSFGTGYWIIADRIRIVVSLKAAGEEGLMTQMEVAYRYGAAPGEAEMRAMDNVREVYGVRKVWFNEKDRTVRLEYDASRFKEPVIAALLRRAGIDIQERLVLA